MIPVYKNMSDAMRKHPEVDVLINFASLRSAYDSTVETMNYPQVSEEEEETQGRPIKPCAAASGTGYQCFLNHDDISKPTWCPSFQINTSVRTPCELLDTGVVEQILMLGLQVIGKLSTSV